LRMAEEMLRIMPKHKGTTHLQADLKTKISRLKKQIAEPKKAGGTRQTTLQDHVEREGAGQIILIGPPNSGKSSLVDAFTNAEPLVADYPYSTREPLTGMMNFQHVQLQLIDTPPIAADRYDNYLSNLIRNADIVTLVCDLADPKMVENVNVVIDRLEEKRILLKPDTDERHEDPSYKIQKTIICAHKEYEDESGDQLARLKRRFPDYVIVATSILDDVSLEQLKQAMFASLGVMRIFTKQIGKEVDLHDPVVLPIGGTVEDAANAIHKDFGQKLKFAKIWGEGKFDGQRVKSDFVLSDGDSVEFHI
ncbi:MAG: TGS domain-containing protein, partial [Deltaproteobacteria bacterium]|nr:TGS domain-containing protein [Deltaproteobacteria bacterium]